MCIWILRPKEGVCSGGLKAHLLPGAETPPFRSPPETGTARGGAAPPSGTTTADISSVHQIPSNRAHVTPLPFALWTAQTSTLDYELTVCFSSSVLWNVTWRSRGTNGLLPGFRASSRVHRKDGGWFWPSGGEGGGSFWSLTKAWRPKRPRSRPVRPRPT